MEFRKILYLKNKNINIKNCYIADDIRDLLKSTDKECDMVLRILVNDENHVIIEFAEPISLDSIRRATELNDDFYVEDVA